MLYNVVIGNTQKLKHDWRVIESNGFWFYDKSDLNQRIRIDQSLDHEIKLLYKTDNVQCYDIGQDKRWRNNTSNLNGTLRPIYYNKPNADTSEQILVYVTVMNNYQIIDFETSYSILNTYHKKGEWQGCTVVLTKRDVEKMKNPTVLRIYAYNKKKEQPVTIEVSFNYEPSQGANGKVNIDTAHLSARTKGIKDADEKKRVLGLAEKYKGQYMGFKCIIRPNVFLTSTYFVSKEYEDAMKSMVRFKNRKIVVVDKELLKDKKKLSALVASTCKPNNIRAITEVGIKIPVDVLTENRLIYVFTYCDRIDHGLSCIKSK